MCHSVKISREACQGCVNCIRVCPTEAIRIVDGEISILEELCIDCGECLRSCRRQALGIEEEDWNEAKKESPDLPAVADPVFFSQFSHFIDPETLEAVLVTTGVNLLLDETEDAFDLSAALTAQMIARSAPTALPLVSCYCPAALRLIQARFPELLPRVLPVCSPLELAADLWKMHTDGSSPVTLFAPCSAKISMVRDPQGLERSPLDRAVTVRRVARSIMAGNVAPDKKHAKKLRGNRWIQWARRGGESKHIQAFSEKKLNIIAVSGMRNTIDVLQELELGRLRSVDFVECRTCDTGCVGGVGTADSRFLASLRLNNIQTEWNISKQTFRRVEELCAMDFWPITKEYAQRPRLPLSNNVAEAMVKLQQMKEIYSGLPHIDCGSCGRPSCQAMAEEIVRGHGSVTDCIFKLREGIASLAGKIVTLSESQPQTLKRRSGTK